ncbi:hypothetical protein E2C01_071256 [Portunus trituberculatus]|uniref:Uncharacterized protein n=1 Tax=Portunus trituberculatus TaxID=210409 RepID=A0A5B7I7R2_PORTR|nr:hypothetical protein [Portunus trituberculatus]
MASTRSQESGNSNLRDAMSKVSWSGGRQTFTRQTKGGAATGSIQQETCLCNTCINVLRHLRPALRLLPLLPPIAIAVISL